ncbi:MAG: SIS domain-containing protein [Candidatus Heimdallarchaeota archaeon]|nr:MAG: SIS domain-containing protein [Candidatus Heimdallarchaeota archaeon]
MSETVKNPDFMLSEMLEQPRILDSLYDDTNIKNIGKFIIQSDIERIIFTGSGDSYCAAWYGAHIGQRWRPDLDIRYYAPFEFVNYSDPQFLPKSVVIGLSVSGNTPRVVEALRFANKFGAKTIGITDNPQGQVAAETDHTLFIHASPPETLETSSYVTEGAKEYTGYHHDVAQTKTYLANLAVQSLLVAYFSSQKAVVFSHIRETFQLVKITINQRSSFLKLGNDLGRTVDKVIFVSSGANGPTGLFGSYKMFEFSLNGYACDIEEYCHTNYFITTENSLVIFIAPDFPTFERIREVEPVIRDVIGSKTIVLVNPDIYRETKIDPHYVLIETPKNDVLSPLVYTIPIEFLTYSIAKSNGFDTNQFRGGQDTEKYVSGSYRTIRQSKIYY